MNWKKTSAVAGLLAVLAAIYFYYNWYTRSTQSELAHEGSQWKERDEKFHDIQAKQKDLAKKIRAAAGSGACETSDDCRVIGLGAKICEGYRDFFHYSIKTVDEEGFISAVEEFNRNQQEINDEGYKVSDCGQRTVPTRCFKGHCGPVP